LRSLTSGVTSACMKKMQHIAMQCNAMLLLIYFFLVVSDAADCVLWLFQSTNMDANILFLTIRCRSGAFLNAYACVFCMML
jgi:hypothetical protein